MRFQSVAEALSEKKRRAALRCRSGGGLKVVVNAKLVSKWRRSAV